MQPEIKRTAGVFPTAATTHNLKLNMSEWSKAWQQEKIEYQLKLRPYQEECLQSINDHYSQGVHRQLVHLPTAGGKTVIFSSLIQQLNRKTLVLAHTTELLEQARDKINMINPNLVVGIVKADRKEYDRPVVVSTIQSARQPETLEELKKQEFSLCIYDECHRAGADSPRHVLSSLGFLGSDGHLLCGFSATPWRDDSKGLGEIFEKCVYHKSIKDLIALGYLCPPRGIKIKTDLDLGKIRTTDGDFVSEALADYMNTPEMTDVVINAFHEHALDRKTVCFSVNVAHAIDLANAFKSHGITSEAVYGAMPQDERENHLKAFESGKIQVLTNCQILTEGWDCPSVSCVLIARPTQSKGLFQQMAGRGLRLFPNKNDCLVLDFGSKSHSLCGVAEFLEDSSEDGHNPKPEGKMSEFAKRLPPSINRKLKACILEFDLLGDTFTWIKDGEIYSLKGSGDQVLKIFPTQEKKYSVIHFKENESIMLANSLSFEYAFGIAEEFAKTNRALFTVSDLDAPWRSLPISDKQKSLFRSYGFRAGIEDLSRGQAALIIGSGILNKKSARDNLNDFNINQ